jgi:hypothetical protein
MSDRVRYLGFAGFLGAGISLFVYRAAVMGLVWDGSAKHVLDIAALGLALVAGQLLRSIPKPRQYPWLLMIVAAGVGFGVAFGICFQAIPGLDQAQLTTRALPGFSIGLPSGTEGKSNLTYSEGAVQINEVIHTGNVVRVGWEPGRMFDDSEVEMIAKGLGSKGHSSFEHGTGPHGKPTVAVTVETDKGPIRVIITTCGARRIMIMASESAKLAARMLATLTCHPDAAQETGVDTVPWTTQLPAGWFSTTAIKGQLALTDGNNVLLARTVESMPDRAGTPKLLQTLMNAAGVDMTVDAWADDRYPVHATIEGKQYGGFAMPIDCGARTVLLLGFARDDATTEQIATFAKQGRCLAAGETPPPWPTKP